MAVDHGGSRLTDREIDVLVLAAAGKTNKRIGTLLGISARTVELHVETMLRRSGAECRAELIARCYAAGVLSVRVWPPTWSGRRHVGIDSQSPAS